MSSIEYPEQQTYWILYTDSDSVVPVGWGSTKPHQITTTDKHIVQYLDRDEWLQTLIDSEVDTSSFTTSVFIDDIDLPEND